MVAKAQHNPAILGTYGEIPTQEGWNILDVYGANVVAALGNGSTVNSLLPQKDPELPIIVDAITKTEGRPTGKRWCPTV